MRQIRRRTARRGGPFEVETGRGPALHTVTPSLGAEGAGLEPEPASRSVATILGGASRLETSTLHAIPMRLGRG